MNSSLEAAQQSDSDRLFEMANLPPKHTGLPFVVWISTGQGVQHDVRVTVSDGLRAIPSQVISVALHPDVPVVEGTIPPETSHYCNNGSRSTKLSSCSTGKVRSIPSMRYGP